MNLKITILSRILLPLLHTAGIAAQQNLPLADPFILLHGNTYYAYGTHSERGIEVYTSDNLTKWRKHYRLALDKNDTWGEKWFWAPEVYHLNGVFYMYYSADEHICAAVSDSPLGPFVQKEHKPMIENERTLDASVFFDDKKIAYLIFVRYKDEVSIWIAEMTANMLNVKPETMRKCLSISQDWEKIWPNVMHGPSVFRHGDTYYMLYYANNYASHFCGIGYAAAPNVWGPWTKSPSNPLLQRPGSLVGTGHGSVFVDKQGNLRMTWQSHTDKKTIEPRIMHIGRIKFRKTFSGNVLTVDKSFITPVLER